MNRIVQSEEEDSKVTRVKLGRINFPHADAREGYYLCRGAGLGFTMVNANPVQWKRRD